MIHRYSNHGGNTRDLHIGATPEDHDAAMAQLSREFKEFLTHHDIGGYDGVQLLKLVQDHGEAQAMLGILINKNIHVYETYGPKHPSFDPRLPYRRSRR